jgi:2-polyprenyl-6-methoxyphenol hydroxylase-like FAD-dependent oxidoreductase
MPVDNDLVVVGAGPTGLSLALQASLMGVRVRIIDRRPEPRIWAPALAIHPRTMEILRGLGVADELVARGLSNVDLSVHGGDKSVTGTLGDLRLPVTEFPFVLFAPQPEVEAVLAERLAGIGVGVEWGSELRALTQGDGGVECSVAVDGEERIIDTRYVVGCDGAESTVRRQCGIEFRGRNYRDSIMIADIGPIDVLEPKTAHAFLAPRGILFFFPLLSGKWRLIGPAPGDESPAGARALVRRHCRGEIEVGGVAFIKVIRPQHRLAGAYRRGRVFLAGDAAHVHSPAGAQGMNTGIQDAANLGWKLGMALRGGPVALLDTYEAERRPVARWVVRLTGLAHALEVSELALLRWGRRWAALPIASLLLPRPRLMSMIARVVSGIDTKYRSGAVDAPRFASHRNGTGRRLPDAEIDGPVPRLHRIVDAKTLHLIVFEQLEPRAEEQLLRLAANTLSVHRIRRAHPGVGRVAWVLVRPDGYIATSGEGGDLTAAERYMRRWIVEDPAPAT